MLQKEISYLKLQKTIVAEQDLPLAVAQRKQLSLDTEISGYQDELKTAQAKLKKLKGS